MSDKLNILLLSCPPEFAKALKDDGHQIQTSELNSHDILASPCCFRDDTPAYEYDLIICSPHGSISREQISATDEPVNSLDPAVSRGKTIVVVFLNHADYEIIEPPSISSIISRIEMNLPEDKRDNSRLAIEKICQRFYPHILIGYAKDNNTAFANNPASKKLKPVLEPFTKKGIPQFPWSPLSGQFKPGYRCYPGQSHPILVNRIEQPHALWIQRDQGGYLFLPEFQDNLAVLRALLNMPITELPKIVDRAEMAEIEKKTKKTDKNQLDDNVSPHPVIRLADAVYSVEQDAKSWKSMANLSQATQEGRIRIGRPVDQKDKEKAYDQCESAKKTLIATIDIAVAAIPGVDRYIRGLAGTKPGEWTTELKSKLTAFRSAIQREDSTLFCEVSLQEWRTRIDYFHEKQRWLRNNDTSVFDETSSRFETEPPTEADNDLAKTESEDSRMGDNKDDSKKLRDIANIFKGWNSDAENGKYKNNKAEAEKIIRDGLKEAAEAVPIINKSIVDYSLRDYEPQPNHPVAANALHFLRRQHVNLNKEAIARHHDWLVKEVMGESGPFLKDYLALANELNRWAGNLEQDTTPVFSAKQQEDKTDSEDSRTKPPAEAAQEIPESFEIDASKFNRGKTYRLLERIISDSKREGIRLNADESQRTLRSLKTILKNKGYPEVAKSLNWNKGKPKTTIKFGKIIINPKE